MGRLSGFIFGAAVGAGAMYLFDPQMGNGRRVLLRARRVRLGSGAGEPGGKRTPDDVLAARVRSNLGRVAADPGAIGVAATDGHIALSGRILADEAPRLLASTRLVRGVMDVDNRLDAGASAEGPPGPRRGTPTAAR